jgi:hypothetical protein
MSRLTTTLAFRATDFNVLPLGALISTHHLSVAQS